MRIEGFPRLAFAFRDKVHRAVVILAVAVYSVVGASPAAAIENLAYPASIVLDAKTGAVLYSHKADNKRYPASVTKVMTLYILFQELEAGRLSLSTKITASRHAANARPTKLGLRRGSTLTVEEAILSMIIVSANDAARAVAELISGSEERFAQRMTSTAHMLGMKHTNYANASGWPDPKNYTTARDQAIIGTAIYQHFPQFYHYFERKSMAWNGRNYTGHNNVLGYNNVVDGLKTGWTTSSGSTILTSARDQNRHIVVVVFGYPGAKARDAKVRELVATYFARAHAGGYWREALIPRHPASGAGVVVASAGATPLDGLPPVRPDRHAMVTTAANVQHTTLTADQIPARPTETAIERVTQVAFSAEGAIKGNDPIGAQIIESPHLTAYNGQAVSPQSGWIIQIGALDTPESAEELLQRAAGIEASLASARSYVEPVDRNGKTLYRARFSGFPNRTQASSACAALTEASLACLAISG